MVATPGVARTRRIAVTSHPEIPHVDHPFPNWERDQPNIPLVLANGANGCNGGNGTLVSATDVQSQENGNVEGRDFQLREIDRLWLPRTVFSDSAWLMKRGPDLTQ